MEKNVEKDNQRNLGDLIGKINEVLENITGTNNLINITTSLVAGKLVVIDKKDRRTLVEKKDITISS